MLSTDLCLPWFIIDAWWAIYAWSTYFFNCDLWDCQCTIAALCLANWHCNSAEGWGHFDMILIHEVHQNCQSSKIKGPSNIHNHINMHVHTTYVHSIFQAVKYLGIGLKYFRKLFLLTCFIKLPIHLLFSEHILRKHNHVAYLKDSKSSSLCWNCNCHRLHRGNLEEEQMAKTVFSDHFQEPGFRKVFLTFYSTSLVWSRKRFWVSIENISGFSKEVAVTVTSISVLCALVRAANRLKACRATTVSCWKK